jgi:hypothetical protein
MLDLTQSIASSRDDRVKTVRKVKEEAKRLTGDARDLIKGFQASRKELKAELKEASDAWQELTAAKAKK